MPTANAYVANQDYMIVNYDFSDLKYEFSRIDVDVRIPSGKTIWNGMSVFGDDPIGSFELKSGYPNTIWGINSWDPSTTYTINLRPYSYFEGTLSSILFTTQLQAPSFEIDPLYTSINEGEAAVFTLATPTPAGTSIVYTISGVSPADIVGGGVTGSVVIGSNGQATISISTVSDKLSEGNETLVIDVLGKTASVLIRDTSVNDSSLGGEVSVSGTATNSAGKNESVVGSVQIDKFVYAASASSYQVNYSSGRVTVKNFSSGEEDSLTNIERVKFTDKSMAFDITGNAGKAYRVYKAAFARDPQSGDMSGLGFWISRIDNGMDMVEVASRFIDSPEFRTLYGQNPSNADFLTKVYTNVLGRTPDQGGYNWWLNELNTNPTKTKAKVLADFAESGENQTGVASLIGNGIQYTEFVT